MGVVALVGLVAQVGLVGLVGLVVLLGLVPLGSCGVLKSDIFFVLGYSSVS